MIDDDGPGLSMDVCHQVPGFEALLASPQSRHWRHRQHVPWKHIGPLLLERFVQEQGPRPQWRPDPTLPVQVQTLLLHTQQTFAPLYHGPLSEDHVAIHDLLLESMTLLAKVVRPSGLDVGTIARHPHVGHSGGAASDPPKECPSP